MIKTALAAIGLLTLAVSALAIALALVLAWRARQCARQFVDEMQEGP